MSSSSNSDVVSLTDSEEFRNDLYDRIFEVRSTGSFATFGTIDSFVHPGISVDPIGTVRLPLSEEDAHTLIQASHKAPFGKGTETVVDESVRKTWEIGAEKVGFLNERWQSCLDQTVERVVRGLGVPDGAMTVRAEFYKMLLYEKGAMFKAHKDTEKVPGMFGTLIICLPSKHTGGAVCLQHGEKSARFSTSETSAFDTTFVAWYTDVTHEIEPVQTGYRWILTYNLINESKTLLRSATVLDARTEQFVQALTRWHNLEDAPPYLAYPLDHQYTDRDLSLAQLKGDDYHRARHVAQSCTVSGEFYILLANMSMRITDTNDETEQPQTSELLLSHIVDPGGFSLSIYEFLEISDTLLLRRISYSDREPDVQRGGNYLGNQYAEIDQFFKNSVMILVPNRSIMSFLLTRHYSHQTLNQLMGGLREVIKKDDAMRLRELLLQICRSTLSRNYVSDRNRDLYLGPVAVTAVVLRDASLFTKVVKQIAQSLEKGYYYALGELICLQDLVVQEHDIIEALTKSGKLYQTHANLSRFRDGFLQGNPGRSNSIQVNHLRRWLDTLTSNCLADLEGAYVEDASPLVKIIVEREKEPFSQFVLYQGVRGFVMDFRDVAIIVNALMVELCFQLQHSDSSTIYLRSLLQPIIEYAISSFSLRRYAAYIQKTRPLRSPPRPSHENGDKATPNDPGGPIKTFYQYASAHERTTPSHLLQKFQSQASALTLDECKTFLIPFLQDLLTVIDTSSPDIQACIQSLLTTYITRTIGPEPQKPTTWARPAETNPICFPACTDCPKLNAFLQDPELRHYIFPCGTDTSRLSMKYHAFRHFDVERVDYKDVAVAKTLKWWTEQHREWEGRCADTLEGLRKLPQVALRDCLAGRYEEFMELGSMVRIIGDDTGEGMIWRELRSHKTDAVVPRKRPREE